jgi:hypothetical protein
MTEPDRPALGWQRTKNHNDYDTFFKCYFVVDHPAKNRIIGARFMTTNILSNYRPWPNSRGEESPLEDRMVSIKEAAEICSVEHEFIRKAICRRELKVVILGPKTHRLWISDLIRWGKGKQEK